MSATRPTDIFYGHLGEATYDISSHQWHFNRIPQITRKIGPLGPPLTVLQPSLAQGSAADVQGAAERNRSIKKLARSFPELVPGVSGFPELAQESEEIRKNVSRHDPATSDLFAFGKANDQRQGYRKPRTRPKTVPIIAVAGGSTGDAVRLIRLRKEHIGWENNNSVRLTNLVLQDQDQGWWYANGSPIRQLCFAGSGDTARARLAVRYHGAVTVLEPIIHADAVPARSFYDPDSRRAMYSEATLDANPVLTITAGRTGGSPHADVSFNPWRTAQFAIIDLRGHWTIWELKQNTRLVDQKALDAGPSGFVSEQIDAAEPKPESNSGDGWGSIIWAGNRSTVVVADRKTLSVFSIENDTKRLRVPKLFEPKSADQIIDMKRSPLNPAHVFLLTSTRVFWLNITFDNHSQSEGTSEAGAEILLSWVHFRDQQDISLRLDVLDDEDTTMVVLYSRLTSLSTIFTFRMSQSPLSIPLSISDPYLLTLMGSEYSSKKPDHQRWSWKNPSISSLKLRAASYVFQKRSSASGLGALYRENSVRFFYLSILHSDLSLQKCLYVSQPATDPSHIQLPVVQYRQEISTTPISMPEDGFIVPNRVSAKDWEDSELKAELQIALNKKEEGDQSENDADSRTLNFEWLERGIQSLLTRASSPNPDNSCINLDECLETLKTATKNKLNIGTPQVNLLLEMLSTTIAVPDVDVASEILHTFSTSLEKLWVNTEEGDQNICKFLHLSEILNGQISALVLPPSATSQNPSLSHTYDSLLESWISSFPEKIPSRVRIAAEKNVREIAVQLYLAGLGVRVDSRDREEKVFIEEPRSNLDGFSNLSLRRRSSLERLSVKQVEKFQHHQSSSPLVSSEISENSRFIPAFSGSLPTPENTPSLRSKSPSVIGTEDPASQRLRTFASLAPQPILPIAAANVLRHWSEGGDPAVYDFEATERSIQMELEPETPIDEATAKKQQRNEKRLKRQRERSIASSSQPEPTRLRASQSLPLSEPGRNEDGQQLSSQVRQRMTLPSPMEMGVIGGFSGGKPGRWKGKAKTGKKRAPGF